METLTKNGLIREVRHITGCSQADTSAVINTALEQITRALSDGKRVQLAGFGTFEPRHYPSKNGLSISDGTPINFPGKISPVFKAGEAMKRILNGETQ